MTFDINITIKAQRGQEFQWHYKDELRRAEVEAGEWPTKVGSEWRRGKRVGARARHRALNCCITTIFSYLGGKVAMWMVEHNNNNKNAHSQRKPLHILHVVVKMQHEFYSIMEKIFLLNVSTIAFNFVLFIVSPLVLKGLSGLWKPMPCAWLQRQKRGQCQMGGWRRRQWVRRPYHPNVYHPTRAWALHLVRPSH